MWAFRSPCQLLSASCKYATDMSSVVKTDSATFSCNALGGHWRRHSTYTLLQWWTCFHQRLCCEIKCLLCDFLFCLPQYNSYILDMNTYYDWYHTFLNSVWCPPCLVQAPSRFTIFRWGPRWLIIFNSDIRAWVSLLRAVAAEIERERERDMLKGARVNQQMTCSMTSWLKVKPGWQHDKSSAGSCCWNISHNTWQLCRGLCFGLCVVFTKRSTVFLRCMSHISASSQPPLCSTGNGSDHMQLPRPPCQRLRNQECDLKHKDRLSVKAGCQLLSTISNRWN